MTTSDDDPTADAAGSDQPSLNEAGEGGEGPAAAAGEGSRGVTPAMKYTLWGVAGVVVVGVVIAIILSISSPAAQSGSTGATPSGSSPSHDGSGAGASPGADSGESPGAGSAESPGADTGESPGANPGATPVEGSEVIPPAPTPTEPGGLPAIPAAEPLVKAPLPKSASAEGKLVAGFPEDIMGPAPDSDILSSSIATEDKRMQVTLNARTDASQDDVTAHFRALWSGLGLTEIPQTDGSTNLAFSNEFTSLTLGFSGSSGTGTLYTVYGVFRTN